MGMESIVGKTRTIASLALAAALMAAAPASLADVNKYDFGVKVHEYEPGTIDVKDAKAVESYSKGSDLIKQATYLDTAKSGLADEVARLTAANVLEKKSSSFSPGAVLNGYSALSLAVNMTGAKDSVKTSAYARSKGYGPTDSAAILQKEYLAQGQALGIIDKSEERYLNQPVPRYVFMAWLARAGGYQPVVPNESGVLNYSDYASIPSDYRSLIEALNEKRIIGALSGSKLAPLGQLTRKDAVIMMDKALPDFYTKLGMKTDNGLVIARSSSASSSGGVSEAIQNTIIMKADGSLENLLSKTNKKTGTGTSFIYLKGSSVGGPSGILPGDELSLVYRNDKLVMAQKASGTAMFDALSQSALSAEGLELNFGKVVGKKTETVYENGKRLFAVRIRFESYDGEVSDIVVKTRAQSSVVNELLVIKNGKPSGLESLVKGEFVEYYTKDGKSIVYAQVRKNSSGQIKGEIRGVRKDDKTGLNVVTVYDYSGNIKDYPVAKFAIIKFGAAQARQSDIMPGQRVVLLVSNNYIVTATLEGFENGGYIPPESKVRMGTVYSTSALSIAVKEDDGTMKAYPYSSVDTVITRGGSEIPLSSVKSGDKVKLYFNDTSTTIPSKIEVEAVAKPMKDVYRGTIADVDTGTGRLILANASYLNGKFWKDDATYNREIAMDSNTAIYYAGKRLTAEEILSRGKGKTVYVGVADSFGSDMAVQGVIAQGRELTYLSKVGTIDKTYGQMELSNGVNLGLSSDTIVIRDGRIIPYELLGSRDNILVMADAGSSSKKASVVKVLGTVISPLDGVWIGAVEEVNPYSFTLKYYYTMKDTEFTSDSGLSDPISVNNASVITDMTHLASGSTAPNYTPKTLTAEDFFQGKYSRAENYNNADSNKGTRDKRYYAVFKTDSDGQVVGMNLVKSGILPGKSIDDVKTEEYDIRNAMNAFVNATVVTKATFDSIDATLLRMKLTGARDYISASDSWSMAPVDTWIKYDNAIIIKNGKVVSASALSSGDDLSVVRNKEDSLVIVAE